jgi:L-lactate utilization protein LutC
VAVRLPPSEIPEPDPRYSRLASDAEVEATAANLRISGFETIVAGTADEATRAVLERIPSGSEVFNSTSATLDALGIAKVILESGDYVPLRAQLLALDRKTQAREVRRVTAAPDFIVGSVHAVTAGGHVVIASGSGSQLGPYAYTAGRVIWVVGTQKIVPNLEEAIRRIERYSFPLEDARIRRLYGIGSSVAKILIVRQEFTPGRTTIILVKQNLGF